MSNVRTFTHENVSFDFLIDKDTQTWKSVSEWAEFYGISRQIAQRHIDHAIEDGEVDPDTMCNLKLHLGENNFSGHKTVMEYSGDVGIAIGYRARKSKRASALRVFLSAVARQVMTTGIYVNEEILSKQKNKQQIIDELWRKVSFTEAEINYMLSVVINEDDQIKSKDAMKHIYAAVTNKARVAATGMTAAQIKLARCCHTKENLGMTVSPDLKPDKQTARNYLTSEEFELSTAVEQTFTIILRSALRAGKKMGITQIIDLLDHSIVTLLFMDIKPKEAPAKGLADKAKAHVIEQSKLAKLLLEGGNGNT